MDSEGNVIVWVVYGRNNRWRLRLVERHHLLHITPWPVDAERVIHKAVVQCLEGL
jgi:hypothetical protein